MKKFNSPAQIIFQDDEESSYIESSSMPVLHQSNRFSYHQSVTSPYSINRKHYYDTSIDEDYSYTSKSLYDYYSSFIFPKVDNIDFSSLDNITSLMLPPGVRYLTPGIIVFEKPPLYKIVSIFDDYKDALNQNTNLTDYYLPIPWQVYIASYNPEDMRLYSVRMFFSNSSLLSVDQPLFSPPLQNFYANGKLCRPFFSSMEDIEKYSQDYSGIMASAYDWVWNTGFNLDITQNISEFIISKKHLQFEPYLTSHVDKVNLSILSSTASRSLPRNIQPSYIHQLFSLWQKIPLDQINNIIFSNPSYTDYYDNMHEAADDISEYVRDYADLNDLIIHEYSHDSDYDDEYGYSCPSNCISEDSLFESAEFSFFLYKQLSQEQHSIKSLIDSSVRELVTLKVSQNFVSKYHFSSLFFSSFDILSQSS
jgi:hypothetical protein